MNWLKSLLKAKTDKVKVLATFVDKTQTELWVSYTGYFNANKFAEQMFRDYPYIEKIKVLDFK